MRMPDGPGLARLKEEAAWIDELIGREHSGRRVSEIKDELGTAMNRYCAVFRDQDGLSQCLEIVRRLKDEAKSA